MTAGRLIGVMLALLLGTAGCASVGVGDGPTAGPRVLAPVMVEPSQIFNDESQSP